MKIYLMLLFFILGGCAVSSRQFTQKEGVNDGNEPGDIINREIISREIRRGMTQGEVELSLGEPSIVSRNSKDHETWIYERFASRCILKSGGVTSESARGEVLKLVDISSNRSQSWEDLKLGDKPLSVKITFDHERRVDSFSYEASKH